MVDFEEYYRETDPGKRHMLLQSAKDCSQGLEEYELREKIWTRRYGKREKEKEGTDYFIRSLVVAQTYSGGVGSLLLSGTKKIGQQILHDLFLDDIGSYGDKGRQVLYDEFCNCAGLYYSLCKDSKSYRTKLFGTIPMSEAEVNEKMVSEIKVLKEKALPNLNLVKELEPFVKAFSDVYRQRNQPKL